jgi:hypothetical protein
LFLLPIESIYYKILWLDRIALKLLLFQLQLDRSRIGNYLVRDKPNFSFLFDLIRLDIKIPIAVGVEREDIVLKERENNKN